MGNQMKHPAGNFCWFELATSDRNAAIEFYAKLFNWDHDDVPLPGDMGVYSLLRLGDKQVAALYQMGPQQAGGPPHWLPYVAVNSADEAAAKAVALSGEVLMPAFDVMDVGRMAVIKDPTGAVLAVWEPKRNLGVDLANAPGSACWGELATRDTASAKAFYTGLFGWTTKESDFMAYTEWLNGGQPIGGMMPMEGAQFEGVPPHWLTYFAVDDCDATAAQAQSMDGKLLVPPTDIPKTGRFSVIQDPQGAVFAVIHLTM